ncbi:MAG: hypothetical protein Q7J44_14190 [Pseudotabrizicola sp.]|uniref:hypothetical protein n=1 Tax=Pseudotabrizicola sp. TaxID=2939647 RepID=UPI00271EEE91|nr:hypothetical protein [Pseudotabrizicola sp.]MDO9639686.1 hypothetical protein [Pseudotabrizicola sp.]
MAKRTTSTPKPKAVAPATAVVPAPDALVTQPEIGESAEPQGLASDPTPPALGNEGLAAEAGEGQPSLADSQTPKIPEDGVTLSDAIRAGIEHAGSVASISAVSLEGLDIPFDYQRQVLKGKEDISFVGVRGANVVLPLSTSLVVTGPKKGRWRIGRKFGPEPVTLPVAELTEDELQALADDKALNVTAVTPPY